MSRVTTFQAIAIFGGFATWVGLALFANAAYNNFRVRIQLKHPDLWARLARPEFAETRYRAHAPLQEFLLSRRYRAVGDAELTRLGTRTFFAYGLVFLFVALLICAYMAFQ